MPVVLGASNPLSGAGTWSYPHPTLIIGVKLELTTPPASASGSIGSTVRYWKGLGRYALVDEAGTLAARNLSNDVAVDYELSRAPVGINFEWAPGATITATEILSASPDGGGGPGGPMTSCQVTNSSYLLVPDATDEPLNCDTTVFNTDTTNYTPGSGGITVTTAGVYRLSWHGRYYPNTPIATPGEVFVRLNGTSNPDAAGDVGEGSGNSAYVTGYLEVQLAAGDHVDLLARQESGAAQQLTNADLTVSTG